MEDRVISITRHDEFSWLVECCCGFFAYRGNKRTPVGTALLRAKSEARRHNNVSHRKMYRVSTEGSKLF